MDGIYFELLVLVSWGVMLLVMPKARLPKWLAYVIMLSFPLLGLIVLSIRNGPSVWYALLIGITVGPVLEWAVGWFYTHLVGTQLWHYNEAALPGKYTSWYIVPFWGYNVVAVWLILKLIS